MKRQRASLPGPADEVAARRLDTNAAMTSALGEILGITDQSSAVKNQFGGPLSETKVEDEDEEL